MSKEVADMFSSIAHRYDVANDVLSLGIHHLWRKKAVKFAGVCQGASVLDVCTGTGDLAFTLSDCVGPSGQVFGVDFVPEMIELAKQKQDSLEISEKSLARKKVVFKTADALELPFEDSSFDFITVAFGIRNVDCPEKCLKEFARVLKPKGKVLVLEFGKPRFPIFSFIYKTYSKYIMPLIGQMLTGNRAAYEYLPRTAKEFPDRENFISLMNSSGYSNSSYLSFMSGVAYAYVGQLSQDRMIRKEVEKIQSAEMSIQHSTFSESLKHSSAYD